MSDKICRVIIVEDEPVIALGLEEILADLGHEVVATAAGVAEALCLFRNSVTCDVVMLDAILNDGPAEPIARHLRDSRLPFVIATGALALEIQQRFGDVPILKKPYDPDAINRVLSNLLTNFSKT